MTPPPTEGFQFSPGSWQEKLRVPLTRLSPRPQESTASFTSGTLQREPGTELSTLQDVKRGTLLPRWCWPCTSLPAFSPTELDFDKGKKDDTALKKLDWMTGCNNLYTAPNARLRVGPLLGQLAPDHLQDASLLPQQVQVKRISARIWEGQCAPSVA